VKEGSRRIQVQIHPSAMNELLCNLPLRANVEAQLRARCEPFGILSVNHDGWVLVKIVKIVTGIGLRPWMQGALDGQIRIDLAQIEWLCLRNASVDMRSKIDGERVRRATGHLYCCFEVRTVKGRECPIVTTNEPCERVTLAFDSNHLRVHLILVAELLVRRVTRQVNPNGVRPPCGQLGDG
jgi:hypothetical protein